MRGFIRYDRVGLYLLVSYQNHQNNLAKTRITKATGDKAHLKNNFSIHLMLALPLVPSGIVHPTYPYHFRI